MRAIALIGILLLSACQSDSPSRDLGVLAFATIGDVLYVGKAYSKNGTGRFQIHALYDENAECSGNYRYRNSSRAKVAFKCTDGNEGAFRIVQEGPWKGSGLGTSPSGDIVAVFGYSVEEANKKLNLPKGTHLVQAGKEISLVVKPEPS